MRFHLVQTVASVLLYSILHQGGVIPALHRVNDAIQLVQRGKHTEQNLIHSLPGYASVSVHVWSWKLFMPVAHQVVPARLGRIDIVPVAATLYDPPGETIDDLANLVRRHWHADRSLDTHLVLAPSWAHLSFQTADGFQLELLDTVGFHLDLDHLPQLFERARKQKAWPSITVEILRVKPSSFAEDALK